MNRKLMVAIVFLAGTAVWGCVASTESDTEQKLEQSRASYVQCVAANHGSSSECEAAPQASQQSGDQNSGGAQAGGLPLDPTADPNWSQ